MTRCRHLRPAAPRPRKARGDHRCVPDTLVSPPSPLLLTLRHPRTLRPSPPPPVFVFRSASNNGIRIPRPPGLGPLPDSAGPVLRVVSTSAYHLQGRQQIPVTREGRSRLPGGCCSSPVFFSSPTFLFLVSSAVSNNGAVLCAHRPASSVLPGNARVCVGRPHPPAFRSSVGYVVNLGLGEGIGCPCVAPWF